jgi:predicted enzyme related to lactoylglutathione lyase
LIDVTRVDYIRVPVDDIEKATQFYGDVLGLPRNEHLDHDDWIEFEASNVTLAVMTPESHDFAFAPLPPSTIALGVPDVAVAKSQLEAAGVEVGEVWDSGVCQGVGLSDPAGNRILLHHRYRPYDR